MKLCFLPRQLGVLGAIAPVLRPCRKDERHGAFGTGSGDGHATPKWVLQSAAG